MSLNFSENFDGASAPATPSGWNWDASLITTTTYFNSSPNSLYLNDTSAAKKWGTYATSSGDGGYTITSSLKVRLEGSGVEINVYRGGIVYRGSAATLDNSSTNAYWAYLMIQPAAQDKLVLASVASGVETTVSSVGVTGQIYSTGWYTMSVSVTNTSHSVTLQRLSDNFWLNSSGSFVSGASTAISATNSTITSGNYYGVAASGQNNASRVFMDDYSILTGAGTGFIRVPMDGLNLRANLSGGMIG